MQTNISDIKMISAETIFMKIEKFRQLIIKFHEMSFLPAETENIFSTVMDNSVRNNLNIDLVKGSFWVSWLSFLLYFGALFFAIWLIRRYELSRIKLKNQLRLEKLETETLRKLDKLKSHFYTNITHEFRSPLTLIMGEIENVLSLETLSKQTKEKLHAAIRNAEKLLNLINQLLDLAKIDAGSMKLETEEMNIAAFLKNVFSSFESLAQKKAISYTFESELVDIPMIFDPEKMEIILNNLLSNAFKFTREKGSVSCSIKVTADNRVIIAVNDTGTGISSDQIPFVFDRFYQADPVGVHSQGGSGIGLALVKEFVELHGGTVQVLSAEGEGTQFILNFPVLSGSEGPPGEAYFQTNSQKKNLQEYDFETTTSFLINDDRDVESKKLILVVEDNPDVRKFICELLQSQYHILIAEDGEEGLAKAAEELPDLIITDVMMPKLDGYRFSAKIRNNVKTSHIPIVMLTAKAGFEDKMEGLETGIDVFLTKPFSARELKVRINNLIHQRIEMRKRFSKATIIKPAEVSVISADQAFLEKTIRIVETHMGDFEFSGERLAAEVNMSTSQLNRKLNALINQPAGQLIRSLRLQRAADLLRQNSGTISDICFSLGFNDQAYFSRAFKKQFGCSPSKYKSMEMN
jgi:two-component system, sensor histidine kinase ChiS